MAGARLTTRALSEQDFGAARALYVTLAGKIPVPVGPEGAEAFARVLGHPGTKIWAACADDRPVAIATLHVLPNMTWSGRPYALIENVVCSEAHRGQGFGQACVQRAVTAAWEADCYKIMLMTGQDSGAIGFYEKMGFSTKDKHAMTLRRVPTRKAFPA